MRPLRHLRLYVAAGSAYLAALIAFSLVPLTAQGDQVPHLDKAVHLLAYFALMVWFGQVAAARALRLRLALAFVVMGAVLEFLQGLGGSRQAEWLDGLANAVGVGAGAWLTAGVGGTLLKRFESKFI